MNILLRIKQWLGSVSSKNLSLILFLMAISINILIFCVAGPFSGATGSYDATGKPKNFINMASSKHGSEARFDFETKPCMVAKRSFFNMIPLSDKRSRAIAALQENEESACFEGQQGGVIINLKKPILLESMTVHVEDAVKKSAPKDMIVYGSMDGLQYRSLLKIRLNKNGQGQFKFRSGEIGQVKILKLKVLSNWGSKVTSITRITVTGQEI